MCRPFCVLTADRKEEMKQDTGRKSLPVFLISFREKNRSAHRIRWLFANQDVDYRERAIFSLEWILMISFKLLPLAAAAAIISAPALAQDLKFDLINKSSYVVTELYASPDNVKEWEEDILGTDVLGSGETVEVTIADGRRACSYDLRIVFDDGDVVEDTTDLCETGTYTVTD